MTATAVKGVVAILQDYIQLSEGKNAHGHTHTDSMLTSILLSSDKGIINIVGYTVDKNTLTHVQIGAISQTYSHAHKNTYSNCLYMCVCASSVCVSGSPLDLSFSAQRPMHVGSKHIGIMVDEVKGQGQEHTTVCIVHEHLCVLED